ncbi:MAG: PAS domain S-box protein [Methanocella sp.]
MGPRMVEEKKDTDKDRAELIAELNALRDFNSRLKDVVKRYEKVSGKKELYRSLYDLEAGKESLESLHDELMEKQREVELQGEELATQNEELRVQLEEINARDNEAASMNAALRESEERYRSLFEHMLNGFAYCKMLYDNHGNPEDYIYLVVNTAFGRLTGLENVVGKRATEAIPETIESHPELLEIYGRVAATGKPEHFENDFKHLGAWLSISVYSTGQGYFTAVFDNITERKQAEEALCESEERFRALADNIPNLAWMANADGWIFWYNKQWYDYTGTTLEEMQGWGWRKVHHPDHVKAVMEEWSSRIKAGQPYDNVFPLRGKDGNYRWFLTRVTPIRDAQGNIQRWFGTNTDITERKRAEEALRESEEKHRELVENANSIILRANRDGTITFFNEFAQRFFDYSETEIIGRNAIGTIIPASDSAGRDLATMLDDLLRHPEEYRTNTHQNMRKNGELVWVAWTNKAIYDDAGNLAGLFSVGNDITQLKRAEEALWETRDYLESLINYANAPIIVWDPGFTITQFNHAFEWLSGYEVGEVVGKNLKMLFPPGSIDESLEKIRSTLDGERWESVEIPILCKDGSTRIALWNSANIYGEHDKLLATIAQGQDITERKQAEKELKETKAQVELFLDLMGHDINNMNMAAMGFLELARETIDGDGKLDSANVDLLDSAFASINSSSILISNVRKLQRGRMGECKPEVYNLGALVGEVCEQFKSVPDKQVNISFGKANGVRVQANELLRDVFANLVGNAIKHSKGLASINISMNSEIKDGRRYCTVSIEDNGPGIPDLMKSVIFDRFRRGDTKAQGSGLGLYLVKSLVESYGGRAWVEDRVKGDYTKGAKFVVMLPAVDQ